MAVLGVEPGPVNLINQVLGRLNCYNHRSLASVAEAPAVVVVMVVVMAVVVMVVVSAVRWQL